MADFERAFNFMMDNEDPKRSGVVTTDQGGRTRFGIAEKYNPGIGADFYTSMPAAAALERAKECYRHREWTYIQGEQIASDEVAEKLLDMAVNMGQSEAVLLLQRVVNAYKNNDNLGVDGKFGPITLAATNEIDAGAVRMGLRWMSRKRYDEIIEANPADERDRHSWMTRADQ